MSTDDEIARDPDDGASISSTSTAKYEQEPFATFQFKVVALIEDIFPHLRVEVQRIRGGSWNRITGVTLSDGARYIVRSPRLEPMFYSIPDEVAALRYIQEHTAVPVPQVICYDQTIDNPLQQAYSIQGWVEGRNLREVMMETGLDSRMAIARAVVQVVSRMYVTGPFSTPGVIAAKNHSPDTVVFKLPGRECIDLPNSVKDSLSFLTTCYDQYTTEARARGDNFTPGYMEKFKATAIALHAERPFSNHFCIVHPDFEPRNILVRKTADEEYVVEAVLDYDGAFIGPIEGAWSPPHWLWTWDLEDTDDDDDSLPFLEPPSQVGKEVKIYVEKELEHHFPGFLEIWRSGSTARELLHFAIHDLDDVDRADRLLGPSSLTSSSRASG